MATIEMNERPPFDKVIVDIADYVHDFSDMSWGFYDVAFKGQAFRLQRPYGCYVMENVLFKVSYPAEFHAQTAVEAAVELHAQLKSLGMTYDNIRKVRIRTHEACLRIIDKRGPLHNPADRDHCIQYMVAVPLIWGRLQASDYENAVAADPRIDALRDKIECFEDRQFTHDYLDPAKRSIPNGITLELDDGLLLDELVVEYPLGHKRRRKEALPVLMRKFEDSLSGRFSAQQRERILEASRDRETLENMFVPDYIGLYRL